MKKFLLLALLLGLPSPLFASNSKGYQSNVDTTSIPSQFLIAGAGDPSACAAKGKVWKSASKSWKDSECKDTSVCSKGTQKISSNYYNCAVAPNDCSCQESWSNVMNLVIDSRSKLGSN